MPRSKKSVPAYSHHKATGQAFVRFTVACARRVVYLGKFDSPQSKAEYQRILAELLSAPTPSAPDATGSTGPNATTDPTGTATGPAIPRALPRPSPRRVGSAAVRGAQIEGYASLVTALRRTLMGFARVGAGRRDAFRVLAP
jgi:hypothetical protein